MTPRRAIVLAPAAALVVALAGCSSSDGSPSASTAAPAPTSSAASSGAAHATKDPRAVALAARMDKGMRGLTSAHLAVDAGTLGGRTAGDVTYHDGTATASDLVLDTGAERTRLLTVGTTTYAMLPSGRNTSGKPWVKVSATSTNEFVRALASSLDVTRAAASLPAVAEIVSTASSIREVGTAPKAAAAHHYSLVVDPSRSAGTTLGGLLAAIGQSNVPVELFLDGAYRPVRIAVSVKIGSQAFDFTVVASAFDAPVTIAAPPAGQVATG